MTEQTPITERELITRGLELPEDFTLNVEDLDANRDEIRGLAGIYRFYSMSEGDLFIGATDDLWKTLQMTIKMYGNGNKKLQQAISGKDDVYLYIYPESNAAMATIYEGYLHKLYDPLLNNKNVIKEIKKPKKKEAQEEELTGEAYELAVLSYEMLDAYREGATPEELAYENNLTVARTKYLIFKRMTDPEEMENFS